MQGCGSSTRLFLVTVHKVICDSFYLTFSLTIARMIIEDRIHAIRRSVQELQRNKLGLDVNSHQLQAGVAIEVLIFQLVKSHTFFFQSQDLPLLQTI